MLILTDPLSVWERLTEDMNVILYNTSNYPPPPPL
jgi:hypothetical protein